VVRFNLETKEVNDFYVNKVLGIEGVAPERPTAAIFDPNGNELYVLDFGELIAQNGVFWPSANTGALWRISKVESLGLAGFARPCTLSRSFGRINRDRYGWLRYFRKKEKERVMAVFLKDPQLIAVGLCYRRSR
jgi:hypothetical protein